ncbi:proton myo-inositol cotransporter-like [Liolophura sinensis]|uniref:proton myo-inositol cotransporter-like n=1 Tax=Liolophura sinensis TaxID=3198878 RepID=UPI0031587574
MSIEMVAKRPLLQDDGGRGLYSTDDEDEEELFTQPPSKGQHALKEKVTITTHVKLLTAFASIGQFLFGYDTGVISGSMLFIRKQFGLGDVWQEAIVSATIVAAALFAFIGGPVSDWIGRRLTAVGAGLLFTLGSVVLGTASGPPVILAGRVIVGCGLGLTSMCLPMYLSECAPAKVRGRLLLISCTFGCSGMLCANIVDGFFSYKKTNGWRYMLGIASMPSVIMVVGFLLLPESPRWLVKAGKLERARYVLEKLRAPEEVENELSAIRKICDEDNVKKLEAGKFVLLRILRHASTRRALLIGCGLQMFQQLAAINTVMCDTESNSAVCGIRVGSGVFSGRYSVPSNQ